ncbi:MULTISPECIES: gliding motility-associated C-terminal domain-containing protein [Niastella]|uniref:Gliding motility-associated C-terminal domain-containing protein n=1 Tax=Niastella soli TaxID=2821487 RepID=A0ABS3YX80_9BACT|nr:gliding motility-associated C-terminal domain-containing protein [Niastella soli]MBO9202348.1 gliding motility-associated C-terminal domain-containing protein [Niastella soli]
MKILPYLLIGCILTLCCNYAHSQTVTLQISGNPITCHGSEGLITFNGFTANTSYQVSYSADGIARGPITLLTNASGQLTIPNLSQGSYRNFKFTSGGTTLTYTQIVPLQDPYLIPTFNPIPDVCEGDPAPTLPAVSLEGYGGTWNPSTVNTTIPGTYTFTFTPFSPCGRPAFLTVTVNAKEEPIFSFGKSQIICNNGTVPLLTNTSTNGITGFWTPAVVDPTRSATYVFTQTTPGCYKGTTFSLTVNPTVVPVFTFQNTHSICKGDGVPTLPNTSTNGITGTWTPAVVDPNNTGTYLFTPDNPSQCGIPVPYTLTVNPIIPPVFNNFPNSVDTICNGDPAPLLPANTDNGMTGTWTPAVVSNTKSGTYVFTSTSDPCAPKMTLTVTVNPILTPTFSLGPSQSACINARSPVLPGISKNGITGTWTPAIVDDQNSALYTFKPATGQCAVDASFDYQVSPVPSIINVRKDTSVYDGAVLPYYDFPIDIPVTGINWNNNNPGIGLAGSGSGVVPSFTATNMTNDPISGVVTATPYVNGCIGATQSYKITVLPLDKDIFVPNVFSPNGDGKNDLLYVYSNYIATFEMHIFNQWGQKMISITDKKQGWDGKFKGSPQPVGVYVYILKAMTTDGRQINRKGSITIVR